MADVTDTNRDATTRQLPDTGEPLDDVTTFETAIGEVIDQIVRFASEGLSAEVVALGRRSTSVGHGFYYTVKGVELASTGATHRGWKRTVGEIAAKGIVEALHHDAIDMLAEVLEGGRFAVIDLEAD